MKSLPLINIHNKGRKLFLFCRDKNNKELFSRIKITKERKSKMEFNSETIAKLFNHYLYSIILKKVCNKALEKISKQYPKLTIEFAKAGDNYLCGKIIVKTSDEEYLAGCEFPTLCGSLQEEYNHLLYGLFCEQIDKIVEKLIKGLK